MMYLVIALGEGDPFAAANEREREAADAMRDVLAARLGPLTPKMHVVDEAALCRRITGHLAERFGVETPYA